MSTDCGICDGGHFLVQRFGMAFNGGPVDTCIWIDSQLDLQWCLDIRSEGDVLMVVPSGTTVRDFMQMNALTEAFGDKFVCLGFPCNQVQFHPSCLCGFGSTQSLHWCIPIYGMS